VAKRKLTLSVEEDLLREVKSLVASEGGSLSRVFEEFLEYMAPSRWLDELARELGLGELEPIAPSEVPRLRPRGLDAARIVRELRAGRAERVTPVA